jgi:hypothetical protein
LVNPDYANDAAGMGNAQLRPNGQITTAKLERGYFGIRALSFLRHSALVTPRAFNEFRKLVEKVSGIMRPGCSLGMILHTEDWEFLVPHSLDCAVVQVDVRDFHVGRERLGIDGEPVVLCRDRYFAAAQIFYRLVGAAVAEFQFECRSAKRESENLMTETNPEDWFLAH